MADKKISALTGASTPLAGTEVLPIVQGGSTVKVAVSDLTAGRAVATGALTVTGTASATGIITSNVTGGQVLAAGSGNTAGIYSNFANTGGTLQYGIDNSTGSYIYSGSSNYAGFIGTSGATPLVFATNAVVRMTYSATGDATVNTGNLVIGTSGKGIDFSATPGTGTSELFADYEEGTWTPVCSRQTGGAISAVYGTQLGKYTKVGNLVTVSALIDITSVSSQGSGENRVTGLPYTPANNSLGAGAVARGTGFLVDIVISCWGWTDAEMRFSNNTSASGTSSGWKAGLVVFTFSYFV